MPIVEILVGAGLAAVALLFLIYLIRHSNSRLIERMEQVMVRLIEQENANREQEKEIRGIKKNLHELNQRLALLDRDEPSDADEIKRQLEELKVKRH